MIGERIGEAALRAYPPAVRQARGLEMLGMVLDAGERSNRALMRESASLVLGGLRERGALAARAGSRRLVADACCQAVLIFLTLWLVSALNTPGIAGPSRRLLVQEVTLVAVLACALVGYERIAAASGLAALIAFGPLGQHVQLVGLARVLVPIACLLVMVCAPRRRPRDPRRLLWLVPVCVLGTLPGHAQVSLPEILAVLSLGGLLRLLHEPRFAIACSLIWITVLVADAGRPAPAGLSVREVAAVAAGLMVTIAARRLWITRDRATQ